MTPPDFDLIQQRYGRVRRANSKVLINVGIGVSLVALVLFIWIGWGLAKPQATARVFSFNVVDSGLTTLHFEVTKPAEARAECLVEALSTGFAQVGVKTVEVPPGPSESTPLFVEINTSELATTAVVDHCTIVD